VLVVETGAFALQGALKARAVLQEKASLRERPFRVRAVATLFDRRVRIARDLLMGIHSRFGPVLFDTAIRTSARLREAAAMGQPIQSLAPRCSAAQDFAALAAEVEAHARSQAHEQADAPAPALAQITRVQIAEF
jgi:chromosome partitioning protein